MFGRKFLMLRKKIISLNDSDFDDKTTPILDSTNDILTHTSVRPSCTKLHGNLNSIEHHKRLDDLSNENGACSILQDSHDMSLIFGLESKAKSFFNRTEEIFSQNYTLSKFKEIVNDNNRKINLLIDEIRFKPEGELKNFLNRRLFQIHYNDSFYLHPNICTKYHRIKYLNITNKITAYNSTTWCIPDQKHFTWAKENVITLTYESTDATLLEITRSKINEQRIQEEIDTLELLLKEKNSLNDELDNRRNGVWSLLHVGEIHRKKIHEYIHSIKGNIRVYCRVKPTTEESTIRYPEIVDNPNFDKASLSNLEIKNQKTNEVFVFNFDRIFHEESTQEEIFIEIKQFIQSALDGENVCIFAYGSTGSGKTHTMQGNYSNGQISKESGILPRCAEFIFEEAKRLSLYDQTICLSFSAYEIYNENLYDLLGPTKKNVTRSPLNVGMIGNDVQIKGLTYVRIVNKEDIIKFTREASDSRRCDSTQFNSTSSRSHAIFQIKIDMTSSVKNETKTSVISIVDLAGSERSSITSFGNKTKEEIELAKKIQTEANFINKSLTTLGRVICLIGDKKSNKVAVPYRESKLTMVLQNYLKANSKTVMIVTVCSDKNNFNLAKESLKFATNAMMSC